MDGKGLDLIFWRWRTDDLPEPRLSCFRAGRRDHHCQPGNEWWRLGLLNDEVGSDRLRDHLRMLFV
jgi:hypothetical protein